MNGLLLHPVTRKGLEDFIIHTPHALMITGGRGAGKQAIAKHIALKVLQKPLEQYPYFLQISPINYKIGIEDIRQIKGFLSKKTTGTNATRRVVLIEEANVMTIEAQNALLKALEEPPADTIVILTVSDPTALQPTIVSRTQQLRVLPISKNVAIQKLSNEYSVESVTSAYHISGGQVGLLIALLGHTGEHEVVSAIQLAKEILQMDTFERLKQVENLSKQKEAASVLLEGLQRITVSGLEQSAMKNNKSQTIKFHTLNKIIQSSRTALLQNANTKLVLCNLFLQM